MKKYFALFSQYAIGALFGWGLIISGMSNPQKILGFLDLAGNWDPSLIFVMLGAVLVGLAGFLVGFGAHYGSGCTSGHGICGLSRLSPRSLVATLAFMSAGFVMVFVIRHLIGG